MSGVDDLIKEIAVTHGIGVGRDDPILILHTMNRRLLEDSAKAQQEILDRYQEELEALAQRWGDESKVRAERVLNVALDASRQSMRTLLDEGAKSMASTVKREFDSNLETLNGTIKTAQHLVYANVIAAVITLAAALVAVQASIG